MFPIPVHATVQTAPPIRRPLPRIQPFKCQAAAADPDLAVNSCLVLSSAFRQAYAGDTTGLNFETLNRCAHDLVNLGHGEVLYTQVATSMAAGVEKVAESLDRSASVPDAEFLRELLGEWKKHGRAVLMILDIVMYMERSFVLKRGKASVRELGLRAWRDGVVRRSASEVLGPDQDAPAARARPGRLTGDEGRDGGSLPVGQEGGGRRRAVAVRREGQATTNDITSRIFARR
uniref:Cullin-3 n=1 Tax=Aegilops tauschii TaxID=37682 RepID=M8C9K4_AEGTA